MTKPQIMDPLYEQARMLQQHIEVLNVKLTKIQDATVKPAKRKLQEAVREAEEKSVKTKKHKKATMYQLHRIRFLHVLLRLMTPDPKGAPNGGGCIIGHEGDVKFWEFWVSWFGMPTEEDKQHWRESTSTVKGTVQYVWQLGNWDLQEETVDFDDQDIPWSLCPFEFTQDGYTCLTRFDMRRHLQDEASPCDSDLQSFVSEITLNHIRFSKKQDPEYIKTLKDKILREGAKPIPVFGLKKKVEESYDEKGFGCCSFMGCQGCIECL